MNYEDFMTGLVRRNPGETEFHQAVGEVAMSVIPFIKDNPKYGEACILERMTEPDRIITFRVWYCILLEVKNGKSTRKRFLENLSRIIR